MTSAWEENELTPGQVLDGLPDGVLGARGDGSVMVMNRRAAELLGRRRRDSLEHPLAEVLTLLDQDGRNWVEENRPYEGLRTRTGVPEQAWLTPSGHEVLTRAQIHRNRPLGDITAVMITIREGKGRARLDRDRSDLVATVAHELRSPLTGVRGFVQALLKRWDRLEDDQRKLMLQTVQADSERLAGLITELLDVARLDTGRLAMHPRPMDAAVLAARVVDSISLSTVTAIVLHADEGLPDIQADPDKFTQVITNLVENAVRHGAGTVEVALGVEPGGQGVRVSVTDEGPGIPEELRRRAFTKFWTSGASGGTGLGLYLVNGLVRAQRGTLAIEDAPGGGARVITVWPVAVE